MAALMEVLFFLSSKEKKETQVVKVSGIYISFLPAGQQRVQCQFAMGDAIFMVGTVHISNRGIQVRCTPHPCECGANMKQYLRKVKL
jgi:hypothetical protein